MSETQDQQIAASYKAWLDDDATVAPPYRANTDQAHRWGWLDGYAAFELATAPVGNRGSMVHGTWFDEVFDKVASRREMRVIALKAAVSTLWRKSRFMALVLLYGYVQYSIGSMAIPFSLGWFASSLLNGLLLWAILDSPWRRA